MRARGMKALVTAAQDTKDLHTKALVTRDQDTKDRDMEALNMTAPLAMALRGTQTCCRMRAPSKLPAAIVLLTSLSQRQRQPPRCREQRRRNTVYQILRSRPTTILRLRRRSLLLERPRRLLLLSLQSQPLGADHRHQSCMRHLRAEGLRMRLAPRLGYRSLALSPLGAAMKMSKTAMDLETSRRSCQMIVSVASI